MKNIDHYGHWYNEDDKKYIIPRERVSLEFMKKLKSANLTSIFFFLQISNPSLEYSNPFTLIPNCLIINSVNRPSPQPASRINEFFFNFNFFINSNDTLSRGIMYFLSSSLYQ